MLHRIDHNIDSNEYFPIKRLEIKSSTEEPIIISRFECPPGQTNVETRKSWWLITNISGHTVPMRFIRLADEDIHAQMEPFDGLLLSSGISLKWNWDAPAKFSLVELPHETLRWHAQETFYRELREDIALLKFSTTRQSLFNNAFMCVQRGNQGYKDIARAFCVIDCIRILRILFSDKQGFPLLFKEPPPYYDRSCIKLPLHHSVQKALEILESGDFVQISVEELADKVGLSRQHFHSIFKKNIGESPARYLRHIRLNKAIQLIQAGEALARVASTCGFSDQAHLTKSIKDFTGKTPTQLN